MCTFDLGSLGRAMEDNLVMRLTVIQLRVVRIDIVVVRLERPLQELEARALNVFVRQTFVVGGSLAGVKIFA